MPLPIVLFFHALPGVLAAALVGLVLWGVVKLSMRSYGKLSHR